MKKIGWLNFKQKIFISISLILSLSITSIAETTKIGVLVPITGNYSLLGEDCRLGIEIGKLAHPKSNLSFVFGDSQADPKVAVTEFNRLVDIEKVSAVILSRSPVGLAVNPSSLKKQIPLLGMVGHEQFTIRNKFAFQFWPTPTDEGIKLAKKNLALGKRRVAIITSDDDWLITLAAGFKKAFVAGGGEIVQEELIPSSENDLSTLLIRGLAKKPDLVYLNVSIGSLASAIRRLREKNPSISIISNFWVGKPEIIQAAGIEASNGVGFVELSLQKEFFIQSFSNLKTTRTLSGMTYNCYSAFEALDQASASTSANNPKDVYEGMLKLNSIALMDETLPVKERFVQFDLVYKEIKNGKVQELQ